ncbi:hypothetical protein LOCC1_G003031 [Lachnellula occidentalis]|uniref:Uncharacterized protein n=1 Tax=Lachnellula occidentalis TaxID=215460 RepID=A0A8H8RX14_9HELO|nr:hypothetical protein LOCC1_G003031 [Lachnellula occidentalis]
MARNVAQPSRKTATFAPAQTKHAQHPPVGDEFLNKATRNNVRTVPIAQRPVKEAKPVDKHRKPRETVSAAGVFKKSKTNPREKQQHRRRRRSPSPPDLLRDLQATSLLTFRHVQDGIDTARTALFKNTKTTFEDIHTSFTTALTTSREADIAFFQQVSDRAKMLSAPLVEEEISSNFTRADGKRSRETFVIGEQIQMFKQLLEKEEGKLAEYWSQWEECQDEYVDLGVEVFGAKAFGEDGKGEKGKGWRKEMELREVEHGVVISEVQDEVGEIRGVFLKEMKDSEKVSDVAMVGFMMMLTLALGVGSSGEEGAGETASSSYPGLMGCEELRS